MNISRINIHNLIESNGERNIIQAKVFRGNNLIDIRSIFNVVIGPKIYSFVLIQTEDSFSAYAIADKVMKGC